MFLIKSKSTRMEYDDWKSSKTAAISLKHYVLINRLNGEFPFKDKKAPKIEININVNLELGKAFKKKTGMF